MNTVHAKWTKGQIVVEEAVDWPEGCELVIHPVATNDLSDDDVESNDPAAIARWIAEFERIPPLEISSDAEAEWHAARKAQRDVELKTFEERADQIQKALK
jgi:hypothetical protein